MTTIWPMRMRELRQNPTEPESSNYLSQLVSLTYLMSSRVSKQALTRMYMMAAMTLMAQCLSE